MTKSRLALVALVLSTALGGPAIAASSDGGFSPDGAECAFIAEAGGYVCPAPDVGESLTTLGSSDKKKTLISAIAVVGTVTLQAPKP